MKKTIVALIIVAVIAIVIAYRKPIGKFMAGEKSDKKTIDAETKMKAAMIVAAEQATDKAKKAIDAVEKKAQELDAQKAAEAAKENADPAPEPEPEPEDETSWLEAYDEENRIMKINGEFYNIPSRERMASVQTNLIEGFRYLSDSAVTPSPFNPMTNTAKMFKGNLPTEFGPRYRQIVSDMIAADSVNTPKTGIDGKLNKATAVAFAECVRIMPSVVEKYRMKVN